MNPINILVIDDEVTIVERLMKQLKRNDTEGVIGEYRIETELPQEDLESYDINKYDISFDAILIDYNLNCKYTGILMSAWMMLQLRVPRLTLTGGIYSGPKNYFDDFIEKHEISDVPHEVIARISDCVNRFDYSKWLEAQYEEMAKEYTVLLSEDEERGLNPSDKTSLVLINQLLDKFDKIIDAEQEVQIKEKQHYIESSSKFSDKENEYSNKMSELESKLETMIKGLKEEDK
jgi:hypothetical protein